MLLIVGLGNPGEKYQNNRHNIGFMFIDHIAPLLNCSMAAKTDNATAQQCNGDIVLMKPTTFMNRSGKAVTELFKHHKLKAEQLIVIHDDLDIPLGKFKIQKGTGPLLHNGITSIEEAIGSKDFLRVRIGVDDRKPESWIDGETYVLQDFSPAEHTIIEQVFPVILKRLQTEFLHS